MAITGIQSITYGVEALEECIKFHEDFGLTPIARNDAGADFEVVDGSTISIRRKSDPALPPDVLTKPGAREIVWRVDTPASLNELRKTLSVDRPVSVDELGIMHTTDTYGFPIGFRVFEPRPLRFEQVPVNTPSQIDRWNANRKWYPSATPQLIHHVGFAVPDVDRLADFYIDRLGFRVTDISRGAGLFLLADGRHDHHSIFILRSDRFGGGLHWHHVSYGVENIDELMTGANNMQRKGYLSPTGISRHRISSAINFYVRNPAGGESEYLTDIDYVDERWKPRIWDPLFGNIHWSATISERTKVPPPAECDVIEGPVPKLRDTLVG